MTFFTIPRIKRRFASVMLVLWVFALGVAWADACILQDRTTHLDPSTVATAGLPAVSPGHIGVLVSHAQVQSPGDEPCLKVSDDGSQSLVKWQSGMERPDSVTLPSSVMAWAESVAALDARQPVHFERPARTGLSLRIRFVRLAL